MNNEIVDDVKSFNFWSVISVKKDIPNSDDEICASHIESSIFIVSR